MIDGEVLIHIDGASRGNPGDSSYGFAVMDSNHRMIYEGCGYIGKTTNNVAEYTALQKALEWALQSGIRSAEIRTDSELLAKQIQGKYKVRSVHLQQLYLRCRSLMSEFTRIRIRHVPRSENRNADRLANQALDQLRGADSKDRSLE